MRQAIIKYGEVNAGLLQETDHGSFQFSYYPDYIINHPDKFVTFQMPVTEQTYTSLRLFPFFDGLIPEGWRLKIAEWRLWR